MWTFCGQNHKSLKLILCSITGVNSYDIDLQEQKVTITGNVKPDEVLDRISKTGKATSFWAKDEKSEVAAA
jgi:copper chaperone